MRLGRLTPLSVAAGALKIGSLEITTLLLEALSDRKGDAFSKSAQTIPHRFGRVNGRCGLLAQTVL
jgi:hypothetical protein